MPPHSRPNTRDAEPSWKQKQLLTLVLFLLNFSWGFQPISHLWAGISLHLWGKTFISYPSCFLLCIDSMVTSSCFVLYPVKIWDFRKALCSGMLFNYGSMEVYVDQTNIEQWLPYSWPVCLSLEEAGNTLATICWRAMLLGAIGNN